MQQKRRPRCFRATALSGPEWSLTRHEQPYPTFRRGQMNVAGTIVKTGPAKRRGFSRKEPFAPSEYPLSTGAMANERNQRQSHEVQRPQILAHVLRRSYHRQAVDAIDKANRRA